MPTSQPRRRSREHINRDRNRRSGRIVLERSSSFHGSVNMAAAAEEGSTRMKLLRPRTAPELRLEGLSQQTGSTAGWEGQRPRLTKLLLNVTIHGSAGAVQVIMRPESTVGDLVSAAVGQYVKEGRRPVLPTADPSCFNLHYSQFSLESLDKEEKLMDLGSRNFFVCPKKLETASAISQGRGGYSDTASSSAMSCSWEVDRASGTCFDWLRFMDLLL